MSEFRGKKLNISIVGESHSEKMYCYVKGFPAFKFDLDKLNEFCSKRNPKGKVGATARIEDDTPVFGGIVGSKVNGDFSFYIENKNVKKQDYENLYGIPRPSHADYAWYLKDGVLDFSGGGRFSGRLTAPFCVVGGICKQYLQNLGIEIVAYISNIGNAKALSYKDRKLDLNSTLKALKNSYPFLSNKDEMIEEVEKSKKTGDSVGGRIECIVYNMKKGVGNNLFCGLEGKISSLIYSVPSVKGVEFGLGFDFCKSCAGNVNDQMIYNNGEVEFLSNNNGGINGGISNGEEILIGVAIKPTPSISLAQKTINLVTKENETIKIKGRHDSCILPRAVPCIESAVAIALVDELGEYNG